jgi:hypothetical protein
MYFNEKKIVLYVTAFIEGKTLSFAFSFYACVPLNSGAGLAQAV